MVLISVIIPTKNEYWGISRCLRSILSQEYEDCELIIVDGGSIDGTLEIVSEFVRQNPDRIRLIHEPGRGPGYAKNMGSKISLGDILCFMDADDYIDRGFFEVSVPHFADPKVVGLFVGEKFLSGRGFMAEVQDLWKRLRWREDIMRFPTFWRKGFFDKVTGYDERLMVGEDYDLWIRAKKCAPNESLSFRSEIRATILRVSEDSLSKIFGHAIWFGRGLYALLRHRPEYGGPIALWSFFNVLAIPAVLLVVLPYMNLLSGVYFALYLIVWVYLITRGIVERHTVNLRLHILLVPIVQIVTGLGVVIGLVQGVFSKNG